MVDAKKDETEKVMNNVSAEDWEVVSVSCWRCRKIPLVIVFGREK